MTRQTIRRFATLACGTLLLAPAAAYSADPKPGPQLTIQRAAGPITVDGDLSDPGWKGVTPITTWYETNVGDNVEPQVKNVAYLTYDDKYFYAAFDFQDPNPSGVRAPLGDHDAVNGSTDYAGVIVDSHNDGKTAQMFLANYRGVEYDAISSDATGEDNSPDFFWDAIGKLTPTGWTLEIRIPFSSLRYANVDVPTWGILLYRNYPRDHRYQFFSARLPRDVNCFICNSSKLVGLQTLPHGSHLVVAPFGTVSQKSEPLPGLGDPLTTQDAKADGGVDVKWNSSSSLALDGTVRPDFSQIESDAAQIVANERFALFYPEKRPFFLEGVDLLATPIQAVYTRTITSPSVGFRATGKIGGTAYTALVTHDRGGGQVIVPGPLGSDFADQDFSSEVGVMRIRHDLGRSFVSLLATSRVIDKGGHNLVVGPDFQWRPEASDAVTGQVLLSQSQTPNRPDLASEWDGRDLSDHAALASWSHNTEHVDWYTQGLDYGKEFRADDGFVPQVGYREAFLDGGYTIRPKQAFLTRVRFFTTDYYDAATENGEALAQRVSVGSGADGGWNSFVRIELNQESYRAGDQWLPRFRPRVLVQANPGKVLNALSIDTFFGEDIDFTNARRGHGVSSTMSLTLRPSEHLELRGDGAYRTLDVNTGTSSGRLFTADVARLRATWAFNSRSFVRVIGQYVQTRRDTLLYTSPIDHREADFASSALFAFKLNWQTVFYVGYGDAREYLVVTDRMEDNGHQAFTKVSYAWQQ